MLLGRLEPQTALVKAKHVDTASTGDQGYVVNDQNPEIASRRGQDLRNQAATVDESTRSFNSIRAADPRRGTPSRWLAIAILGLDVNTLTLALRSGQLDASTHKAASRAGVDPRAGLPSSVASDVPAAA
jgi:hypothetical protein